MMYPRLRQLTLLVPTKGRAAFLERLLRYYACEEFPGEIGIADASTGEEARQAERIVEEMSGALRLRYHAYPGLRHDECWKRLNASLATPYVAFLGDDDLLLPDGLEQCLAFLDDHPTYHASNGHAALFKLAVPGPYGPMAWVEPYGGVRPLEQGSAAERLRDHFHQFSVTLFSVHRTAAWQAVWQSSGGTLEWKISTEILPGALSVLQGKIRQLPCLYLLRQAHPQQHANADSLEWITNPAWQASSDALVEALTDVLARQDHLSVPDARACVRQAWWRHLAKELSQGWRDRYVPQGGSAAWRRQAGRVPMLRSLWRLRQAWDLGRASLPALLNPASRHHDAFMTAYEVISKPPGKLDRAKRPARSQAASALVQESLAVPR